MDIFEHMLYAGFVKIDEFIVREKNENTYEVYLGEQLLRSYKTPEDAVEAVRSGIDKMRKLREADRPSVGPEDWIQTDDGMDFIAELLYRAEKENVNRYYIGLLLKDFGVLATGSYIDFFVSILQANDYKVT